MDNFRYLILSDLDGTLLTDSDEVTPATIEGVHEINKNREDVLFSFSTGRTWKEARHIYNALQLKGFVSLCNGSHLYNPHKEISLYAFISEKLWMSVMDNDDYFKSLKQGHILTDKGHFIFYDNPERRAVIEDIRQLKASVFTIKCYFYEDNEESKDVLDKFRFLKTFDCDPTITVFWFPNLKQLNIEIQASYASKGFAAEYLSNYYGVNIRNVVTLGDQANDISVAETDSYSIAVKNSVLLMKQKAKYVSMYSNNEDVVIKEVKAFLDVHPKLS